MDVTANSSPSTPYILHRQPFLSILPTPLTILLSTPSALLASFHAQLSLPFRMFDYRQHIHRPALRRVPYLLPAVSSTRIQMLLACIKGSRQVRRSQTQPAGVTHTSQVVSA
ncbi:hypothetical protein C354_00002 [Cryptococcus neoformans MW-RSA1955]|nr:hypothetical protein C354_00002 [Cryptococcus neoformans var. grubii MW-RSA1955]